MEFISETITDSWLTALEEWFKQPNRLSLSSIDLLLSNYDENNIPCCHEASVLFRQLVSSSSLSPSIAKHVFTPTVTKQLIATIFPPSYPLRLRSPQIPRSPHPDARKHLLHSLLVFPFPPISSLPRDSRSHHLASYSSPLFRPRGTRPSSRHSPPASSPLSAGYRSGFSVFPPSSTFLASSPILSASETPFFPPSFPSRDSSRILQWGVSA